MHFVSLPNHIIHVKWFQNFIILVSKILWSFLINVSVMPMLKSTRLGYASCIMSPLVLKWCNTGVFILWYMVGVFKCVVQPTLIISREGYRIPWYSEGCFCLIGFFLYVWVPLEV